MSKEDRAKIKACVGVMVFKDGKFLMGRRKGSHGSGEYSCPGGHLEFQESFLECAKRETEEEAGIKIMNLKFQCVSNIFKHENRQDVLVSFVADWQSGIERTLPDEKMEDWAWYDIDDLPQPLFYPTAVLIDSYKTGKNFYDKE